MSGLSVLVAGRFEPAEVVLERLVVGVVGAGLDDRHDGSRIDEPRQVVDVAVGVVAVDSAAQPDDVADAQVIGEDLSRGPRGRGRGCGPGPRRAGIPRSSAACPGR